MSFADRLARFNRAVTNRGMRRISSRIPPLATVVHRGRRSGRDHRTPVLCFDTDSGVVIALTYGPNRDWVKNVEVAGACTIEQRGRSRAFTDPRVLDTEHGLGLMPVWMRPLVSGWVHHYLTLERASDENPA